jgi:hypothetical protein
MRRSEESIEIHVYAEAGAAATVKEPVYARANKWSAIWSKL